MAQQGAFTYGWQARPNLDLHDLAARQVHVDGEQLSLQAQSLHALSSYSVAYSPARPSSGTPQQTGWHCLLCTTSSSGTPQQTGWHCRPLAGHMKLRHASVDWLGLLAPRRLLCGA